MHGNQRTISDAALELLDREYHGLTGEHKWPWGKSSGDPVEDMLAWAREIPTCGLADHYRALWHMLAAHGGTGLMFGLDRVCEAPGMPRSFMRRFVEHFLYLRHQAAYAFDQPATRIGLRSFRIDEDGCRVWEYGELE